jgi:hypothetical protein
MQDMFLPGYPSIVSGPEGVNISQHSKYDTSRFAQLTAVTLYETPC